MQAHYVQTQVSETQGIEYPQPKSGFRVRSYLEIVRTIEKIALISTSSINVIIEHNLSHK